MKIPYTYTEERELDLDVKDLKKYLWANKDHDEGYIWDNMDIFLDEYFQTKGVIINKEAIYEITDFMWGAPDIRDEIDEQYI